MQQDIRQTVMQLTLKQAEALRLLHSRTHGTMDIMSLAGDRHRDTRQQLIQLWTGRKTPKNQCGVNQVYGTMLSMMEYPVEPTCSAHAQRMFRAWLLATELEVRNFTLTGVAL